ncbi:RluA family pseudouridine synthase [Vicingus serpentipes]|uniref:Pseudouridine synthase n=1 Tax=Vicingus serpentipes TaxID=1926625 RepID=A0A5C6RXB6_9FLAO|nr:RluA family pseudouridine synthase [Vicingus serpentipes]TXB66747.1 RluA family pseudouridine synthase [Vicingus serpentipes]
MQEHIEDDHLEEEQELFEHYNFIADKGQEFVRIDKFLMDRIPNTSRSKIQTAASSGTILVNTKVVKSNYKVKPFDEISIVLPYPPRVLELIPENIPINIVYEDKDVLVLNKQADMVVHPGYGNYTGTLVNALIYHFDNLPDNTLNNRPGLVHRLDKNTTGIMVIAKTEHAMNHLSNQFFERTTERRYNAIVWGDFEDDEGTVIGNVGRSLKNRKVMNVFPDGDFGKHAVTHYKVLKRFGYVTLIECKLETGRTHQIRVHMKHIGHTLFNDYEYGGDSILKGTSFAKYKQFINNCFEILPRQALHAKSLGFTHPTSGEWMQFDSELPDDMKMVLSKWETYVANREE